MNNVIIKYPKTLYKPESILFAANELKEYGYVVLLENSEDLSIEVTIDNSSKISKEEFFIKFNKSLSDYQLKATISDKTSSIRQMIIAQAFAPCDNLNEIVAVFEQNEKQ